MLPDGYHKRTDRKSRTTEKSPSTSKPEFEFSRLDFPELQGPESSVSGIQKQCQWGPLRSSATMSLVGEVGEPVGVVSGVSRGRTGQFVFLVFSFLFTIHLFSCPTSSMVHSMLVWAVTSMLQGGGPRGGLS